TIAAKLVAHQSSDVRPAKAVELFRSDVPAGMVHVVRKMLAKDAAERYREPIEVAEALAEWADLPLDPPPAKEMPGLCPLVLGLTGHSADKVGSSSSIPLGRTIFGPGRGAWRASGSSARFSGSTRAVGTARTSMAGSSRSQPAGGRGGSVSTARNAVASTAPFAPRPSVPAAAGPPPETAPTPSRRRNRTGLYVALGVGFAVLFAFGLAAGAFYLGKANKDEPIPAKVQPAGPNARQ